MWVDMLQSTLSDLAVLEWGLGICISNKLPDVADTADYILLTFNLLHYCLVTNPQSAMFPMVHKPETMNEHWM